MFGTKDFDIAWKLVRMQTEPNGKADQLNETVLSDFFEILFIYLFIYSASPINYMYMKTTNQNSHTHTHTHTQMKEKKTLYGRDTTTAFADYYGRGGGFSRPSSGS